MRPLQFVIIVLVMLGTLGLQEAYATFLDQTHFSTVFNQNKTYRIYFPSNYASSTTTYPVVYFFHGFKGTYNSNGNAPLDYAQIESMVANSQVLLVMWDGRMEAAVSRPYNIGNHADMKYQIQYKDYLPELVTHIDNTYRTLADRSNRATIGFSMGGFMSWYLAGLYPEMIGTAVNMVGSPEFYVGYPNNHTLVRIRHIVENLHGIHLRLHNSTSGELVYLNGEVNKAAQREQGLSYVYKAYAGVHKDNALFPVYKEAFDFCVTSIANPLPVPQRWHHVDLYKNFTVWDYNVTSTLNQPGYIAMHGVTKGGMGIGTKRWLPAGPQIPGVTINVTTAPLYQAATSYTLFDYNVTQDTQSSKQVTSDGSGKISFSTNHEQHQIGIYKSGDPAEIASIGYTINGSSQFLPHQQQADVTVRLLNRGGSAGQQLNATLSSTTSGVSIANPSISVSDLASGAAAWTTTAFKVTASNTPPADGAPFQVRFNLKITSGQTTWEDEFDVPVFFTVSQFTGIVIDDGRTVEGIKLGSGNGDGKVDPGETIMIYTNTHRTRLYYDDACIDAVQERLYDEVLKGAFPSTGYTLSSLVKISNSCAGGSKINFLANYETKDPNPIKRNVFWGTTTVTVQGGASQFLVIEAEDMSLTNGYKIDTGAKLNGTAIVVDATLPVPTTGTATKIFSGASGTYDITLSTIPENDGQPTVKLFVGGNQILSEILPLDANNNNYTNRKDYTVNNITINQNDVIKIEGTSDRGTGFAGARVDKITFNTLTIVTTASGPKVNPGTINGFAINPHPAGASAVIALSLPHASQVSIKAHSLGGKEVALLKEGMLAAGKQNIVVDTKAWENGIYIVTVEANDYKISKQLFVLK